MDLYQVAEIEIIYKRNQQTTDRLKITKAEDAYHVFTAHWDTNKIDLFEQAKIILLNRAARVLGISNISTGGITSTVVDPRLVFVTALKANATSIILAHNHPSANLIPSREDHHILTRLQEAGKLLDIEVLDQLIITSEGYYSFAEAQSYTINMPYPV